MTTIDEMLAKRLAKMKDKGLEILPSPDSPTLSVRQKLVRSSRLPHQAQLEELQNDSQRLEKVDETEKKIQVESTSIKPPIDLQLDSNRPSIQPPIDQQSTSNQAAIKPPIGQQKASKEPPIDLQKKVNRQQSTSNRPLIRPPIEVAIRQQSASIRTPIDLHEKLFGMERKLILVLAADCRAHGENITSPVSREQIMEWLGCSRNRAKNLIYRLVKKGAIESNGAKPGRGGWARYALEKSIYQGALQELQGGDQPPIDLQSTSNWASIGAAIRPPESPRSSSSSLNFEETTTTELTFVIPKNLQHLVARKQLQDIAEEGKLSAYDLQLSIDAFAHDLSLGFVKAKNTANPAVILIGALKNNGGYKSMRFVEDLTAELKDTLKGQREAIQATKREGEG